MKKNEEDQSPLTYQPPFPPHPFSTSLKQRTTKQNRPRHPNNSRHNIRHLGITHRQWSSVQEPRGPERPNPSPHNLQCREGRRSSRQDKTSQAGYDVHNQPSLITGPCEQKRIGQLGRALGRTERAGEVLPCRACGTMVERFEKRKEKLGLACVCLECRYAWEGMGSSGRRGGFPR